MSAHEQVDFGDPAQVELAVRIGSAWIRMRRGGSTSALREFLLGTGEDALEQGQIDTLDVLAGRPAWRMSEVAEALRVDPSTATRAVQRLVNAGLARRLADADDGRVVLVAITDAGCARHAEVTSRRADLMAHLLGAYAPDERPALADLMERFVGAVDGFLADIDERVA